MYRKHMLYTTFYAMYVYKYISFTFHFSKRHLMGPGLTEASEVVAFCAPTQCFQSGLPCCSDHTGWFDDMGEQSLFLAQTPPPWVDRRGLAAVNKATTFFWA